MSGADLSYMHELVEYWAEEYDWPKHEGALDQIPRFHTNIGGLSIHFAPSKERQRTAARGCTAPRPRMARLVLAIHQGHSAPDRPGAHGADPFNDSTCSGEPRGRTRSRDAKELLFHAEVTHRRCNGGAQHQH